MELIARLNNDKWPVKVRSLGNDNYAVCGRGTEMRVAIRQSDGICGGEILVSETTQKRCGCLNQWQHYIVYDIQRHIGIENPVDAATLAAGLSFIIERSFAWEKPKSTPAL